MNLNLSESKIINPLPEIIISGSKSETNRLLILQALYPNIVIKNESNADDCKVLKNALRFQPTVQGYRHTDIHHAGTAMRFLTAYFAQKQGFREFLTGSSRMQERPIGILVDALNDLGASIDYLGAKGFPPLHIRGKKLTKSKVSLPATVSSQYISALLLIAPTLENGLEIELIGEIISKPYINMTLSLLNQLGVKTSFDENKIKVAYLKTINRNSQFVVESDWSSASYYYSIIALSKIDTEIKLSYFKKNSLQGDSLLVEIYKNFGVSTTFNHDYSITLKKTKITNLNLNLNLNATPDLAQTIAVTCFGLGVGCSLSGLQTLKIKETDRLQALKTELEKLGATVVITQNSLTLILDSTQTSSQISIATYQDHRMAMAFAPLALKFPIRIDNAEVVSKSYPGFWEDLKKIGFKIDELH